MSQTSGASVVCSATTYFGFAVSSRNPGQFATAAFRDFSNMTSAGVNTPLAAERLGQSSRCTSLVISEIMFHPTNTSLEFVEIFNSRGEPQDVSGYRIGGAIDCTFPAVTVIPVGGFLVVAKSPADLQNTYGSGTVKLLNQAGGVAAYSRQWTIRGREFSRPRSFGIGGRLADFSSPHYSRQR